jgi:hypothetical protein
VLSVKDKVVTKVLEFVEPHMESTLPDGLYTAQPSGFDDRLLDVSLVILQAHDQALG